MQTIKRYIQIIIIRLWLISGCANLWQLRRRFDDATPEERDELACLFLLWFAAMMLVLFATSGGDWK